MRFSPRALGFFSIVSIFSVPLGASFTGVTATDFGLRITLGAIATVLTVAIVWGGSLLTAFYVEPDGARWAHFLGFAVTAGIARGVVIHTLGPALAFDPGTGILLRIGNSVSTTVVWLVVLTLYANATDEFTGRFQSLLGGMVLERAQSATAADSAAILRTLQDDIRGVRLPPAGDDLSSEDFAQLARALRGDIINRIRTVSQDLWVFRAPVTPVLRAGPLLRLSLARLDYSRGFFLTVFAVLGVPNLASLVGPLEALTRVGVALGVIFLLDLLYRRVIRTVLFNSALLHGVYLLSVGVLAAIPMGLYEFFRSDSAWSLLYFFLSTIPIAALPLLESTLNFADRARNDLLGVLADQSGDHHSLTPGGERVSTASLASYLHNSLQAEIQSIVSGIELAAENPDKASVGRSSLERLRALTERSLDEAFDAFGNLPLEHLHHVVDGWRGILDISLEWTPPVDSSRDVRLVTVVQIIEEVASNAVVHGGATTLDVRVEERQGFFHLTLVSNAPEIQPLRRGVGSSWLEPFLDTARSPDMGAPGRTVLSFQV